MANIVIDEKIVRGLLGLAEWHFEEVNEDREIGKLIAKARQILDDKEAERVKIKMKARERVRKEYEARGMEPTYPRLETKRIKKEMIRSYLNQEHDRVVTIKELCVLTNISSRQTARNYIDELERDGLIDRSKTNSRTSVFEDE